MVNWIDEIVSLHSEFESPLNFWRWAALTAISAVVKDNVYLAQGMFNLYPNIYVMFHADSGLKKGPPVSMAKKLVMEVGNTKVISGRSSIQGILRKLGSSESRPGGTIDKGSSAFICSSELSSSIVEDKAATDILTDLYDRSYNDKDWGSLLKSEEFALKAPVVTMLTATNEAHSASFFERKDVAGGFFARTFIIYENEENRSNSLLVPPERAIDYKLASSYLRDLSKLKGQFQPLGARHESEFHIYSKINPYTHQTEWFTKAGLIYENWYEQFKKDLKHVKDSTGTLNRFGSSVLKVGMILSLGESPSLRITEDSMNRAIEMCQKLIGNARQVSAGKVDGIPNDVERKKILIKELYTRENQSISRAQLLKKYYMHGTIQEWDEVIIAFREAEFITTEKINDTHLMLKMTTVTYEGLKAKFAGKMQRED
jgi:hypothetical protein